MPFGMINLTNNNNNNMNCLWLPIMLILTDEQKRTRMHTSHLLLEEGRKEMFYLTTHSTHFIYGYMASDLWLRTILIVRKETRCRHIGYSFRLTARVLLYASHRQDSTYDGLCYTSRGALAGTRTLLEEYHHIDPQMFIAHISLFRTNLGSSF